MIFKKNKPQQFYIYVLFIRTFSITLLSKVLNTHHQCYTCTTTVLYMYNNSVNIAHQKQKPIKNWKNPKKTKSKTIQHFFSKVAKKENNIFIINILYTRTFSTLCAADSFLPYSVSYVPNKSKNWQNWSKWQNCEKNINTYISITHYNQHREQFIEYASYKIYSRHPKLVPNKW